MGLEEVLRENESVNKRERWRPEEFNSMKLRRIGRQTRLSRQQFNPVTLITEQL